MSITEVWCNVSISMYGGRVVRAHMATAIDVETEAGIETKWYHRNLSGVEAGNAMRKLEKATGSHPMTRYSEAVPSVTEKYVTYCRRR